MYFELKELPETKLCEAEYELLNLKKKYIYIYIFSLLWYLIGINMT